MCGRIAQPGKFSDYAALLEAATPNIDSFPRFNLAPTQKAIVCIWKADTGRRQLEQMGFGLLPPWSKDRKKQGGMINAKCETIVEKPSYRSAFKKRRCLVPAEAFYEWKGINKVKQPFAIRRVDGQPVVLAAIWEEWNDRDAGELVRTFSIVTTSANTVMEQLHDRMPVILERPSWSVWLGEVEGDYTELMKPSLPELICMYPVSRDVNKVANDRPDLLEPIISSG